MTPTNPSVPASAGNHAVADSALPPSAEATMPDVHISFRNMEPSPAMTARIETEIGKLRHFCQDILSCRVLVETLHRHHRSGHHYQLHVTLKIPGAEVVVSHEPAARQALANAGATTTAKRLEVDAPHREPYVVIRDAFAVARRRLEDELRRTRGKRRPKPASLVPLAG